MMFLRRPTTWPSIVMSISLPSSVCEAPSRTTVVLSSNTWNRRVARIMSMNRRLTCRLVKLIFCATVAGEQQLIVARIADARHLRIYANQARLH